MDKGQLLLAGGGVVLYVAIQTVLLIVLERWQRRRDRSRLDAAVREHAVLAALMDGDGQHPQ